MTELQKWQREVGKISLRSGERAFVLSDGRVIASNTNDNGFKEHQKQKLQEKQQKRRKDMDARLEKAEERIANRAKKRALKALKAEEKVKKAQAELDALK